MDELTRSAVGLLRGRRTGSAVGLLHNPVGDPLYTPTKKRVAKLYAIGAFVFLLSMTGCSNSGPAAPTAAQSAAAAAKARQTAQSNLTAIQNNRNLSDDQKARIIAHLNNPQALRPP
jgi:hypothetical protein